MKYTYPSPQPTNTLVVLGAGESGTGAALLAKKQGWQVFVSDLGMIKPQYQDALAAAGIPFEQEKHSVAKILNTAQLVVKSPGIPEKADLVVKLREKGIPIIDEIEFAANYTSARIIAITGSNGKTTTTRLMHHILKTAGWNVGLAGNVGYSLAQQVATENYDSYVVEISSFQLDGTIHFQPEVAMLLNITPDHLDRYQYRLENYIASKFRIANNKRPEDIFIYRCDDENIEYGFQHDWAEKPMENCFGVEMSALDLSQPELRVQHTDFSVEKRHLTLQGRHNEYNITCAVIAAKRLGVDDEAIRKALATFVNEDHRLQYVATIHGVDYINDSKATNVDSVFYALEAMTKPVVWIVGGQDKGNDYAPLFDLVKQKVRAIVCMGKDNSKIRAAFAPIHEIIVETSSIGEAIKVASLYAEKGDVVLLSPACASFDLFENYKDRGRQFANLLLEQKKILEEGLSITTTLSFKMDPKP